MGTVGATSSDAEERQADMAPPQVSVFINYRHDDTQGGTDAKLQRYRAVKGWSRKNDSGAGRS